MKRAPRHSHRWHPTTGRCLVFPCLFVESAAGTPLSSTPVQFYAHLPPEEASTAVSRHIAAGAQMELCE